MVIFGRVCRPAPFQQPASALMNSIDERASFLLPSCGCYMIKGLACQLCESPEYSASTTRAQAEAAESRRPRLPPRPSSSPAPPSLYQLLAHRRHLMEKCGSCGKWEAETVLLACCSARLSPLRFIHRRHDPHVHSRHSQRAALAQPSTSLLA